MPLPQLAKDPEVQVKLKEEAPFTRQPRKHEKLPMRKLVKAMLYCDENLGPPELDYMRDHPEDLEWLNSC
jgi:hypothetical protein